MIFDVMYDLDLHRQRDHGKNKKVYYTYVIIMKLIGTKYVEIVEAVWAESRTQRACSKLSVFRKLDMDVK